MRILCTLTNIRLGACVFPLVDRGNFYICMKKNCHPIFLMSKWEATISYWIKFKYWLFMLHVDFVCCQMVVCHLYITWWLCKTGWRMIFQPFGYMESLKDLYQLTSNHWLTHHVCIAMGNLRNGNYVDIGGEHTKFKSNIIICGKNK